MSSIRIFSIGWLSPLPNGFDGAGPSGLGFEILARSTMRSFFRGLESHAVRYLLISGQATVLYGAATFSEDVDLWIDPSPANVEATVAALHRSRACAYKLTPPLEARYFRKGHGFHFLVPSGATGPVFLDLMGRPPRVGSFHASLSRARRMASDWGELPVVDIPDLVEIKKTRRLADYDVISRLAGLRLDQLADALTPPLLRWALANTFRIEDAIRILERWPGAASAAARTRRPWLEALLSVWRPGQDLRLEDEVRVHELLTAQIGRHQRLDVEYWSGIIQELRILRRQGALLAEGSPI